MGIEGRGLVVKSAILLPLQLKACLQEIIYIVPTPCVVELDTR